MPQAFAGEPQCLSMYPDPRAYSWSCTLSFPLSKPRLNPFRTVQLLVQRVNSQAHEWSPTKPLSKARWLLWFIPLWDAWPGGALCTLLGAVAPWEYIEFLPLSSLGSKSYRYFLLLLSLSLTQPIPSGVISFKVETALSKRMFGKFPLCLFFLPRPVPSLKQSKKIGRVIMESYLRDSKNNNLHMSWKV